MNSIILEDRIEGAIIGHALGDALGWPSEFPPYQKYKGILEKANRYSYMGPIKTCALGQTTDDTEMAMSLFYGLEKIKADTEEIHLEMSPSYSRPHSILIVEEYLEWTNSKIPFIGRNTRNLLKGITTFRGYMSRYKKHVVEVPKKDWTQSNGCLMRAYPMGLCGISPKNIEEECAITNPSPVCKQAVVLYCLCIDMAVKGLSKIQIQEFIETEIHESSKTYNPEIIRSFEDAILRTPRDLTENRGWVCHGLYSAFYALFNFEDYKTAIDAVINHSVKIVSNRNGTGVTTKVGDTDTNGAIAGALLGAFYGMKYIRKNRIVRESIDVILNRDPKEGDVPRPSKYVLDEKKVNRFKKIVDAFRE